MGNLEQSKVMQTCKRCGSTDTNTHAGDYYPKHFHCQACDLRNTDPQIYIDEIPIQEDE